MGAALVAEGLERTYRGASADSAQVRALRGVELVVDEGEFVVLVGPSGCGKSTLLHVLGLLDTPDAGRVLVGGVDTSALDSNGLADIRRTQIGFIFQSFHLLPAASALENVGLPLLYRGVAAPERRARARAALQRVGLADKEHSTPAQLSGGQQQRVAIARALVVEPHILLADEPTGNLDSTTSKEIVALMRALHDTLGLTIVIVTHDPALAAEAARVVHLKDGRVEADERRADNGAGRPPHTPAVAGATGLLPVVAMALVTALRSISRTKLRSALTLLGVTIGIAAVVATSALGAGAKARLEKELGSLGTNLLMVFPGQPTDPNTPRLRLDEPDVAAIKSEIVGIAAAAPTLSSNATVVSDNRSAPTRVTGTTLDYLVARDWAVARGTPWGSEDEARGGKVCLLGATVAKSLFDDESPVGATVRVGRMPCEVIGVLASKGQSSFGQDQDDIVLVPVSTMRMRIAGRGGKIIDSVTVAVENSDDVGRVQQRVTALLMERHRARDEELLRVRNLSELLGALDAQRAAISMLLLAIATVSLLVGGIGVMNIMLVSVTERTREIGMRLAIGARRRDVRMQFLIESVALTVVGGLIGLLVGVISSALLAKFTSYAAVVQPSSALVAFAVSAAIGVVFGLLPAERAARLTPSAALRHE